MRELSALGFRILATRGTSAISTHTASDASSSTRCWKAGPHIVDPMKNGEVQLVFNTTEGAKALTDSKDIRRTALLYHIPYYTTLAGALAATQPSRHSQPGS